ncbi:DUF3137 domain-containing protein [Alkalitalea saponilacus]|uniref:DUF3137 domain-containing protein n=1 Tax=Alkalitalea saponilacus TaxID=889453 RepID=A0A1T5HLN5_9BACT|nr:DUF3137 domain-containing protein [Alkalitalea saponilacus]ASB47814.1 hypothetical protein CDL62_00930 [Alkalitalea saponilacus]SKC21471.1 Protein of unknown function [Alkalitalea saponilacus]
MQPRKKTFDEIYETLVPVLDSLEEVRKKRFKKYRLFIILSIVSIGLFIIGLLCEIYLFIFFLTLPVLFIRLYIEDMDAAVKELRPRFKNEIVLRLLEYFYDDLRYVPNQRVNINLLRKSLLFRKYVYWHSGEDFVSCKVNNIDVCFSEIKAYNLNDQSPIFKGVFVAVMFNKKFSTKTVVINRRERTLFRKARLNLFKAMDNAAYIKLENIEFNNKFLVIGEDQIDARYKLTPALMERMLHYKKKLNTPVSFSFIDNYVYVAIPSGVNLFEPRILSPINDRQFIEHDYIYLDLLTGIVKDLDLNTRIWA